MVIVSTNTLNSSYMDLTHWKILFYILHWFSLKSIYFFCNFLRRTCMWWLERITLSLLDQSKELYRLLFFIAHHVPMVRISGVLWLYHQGACRAIIRDPLTIVIAYCSPSSVYWVPDVIIDRLRRSDCVKYILYILLGVHLYNSPYSSFNFIIQYALSNVFIIHYF